MNWTFRNLGEGGFEIGVKAQALPLCRQLCPSLAISLCLLLITGNQTDLLVGVPLWNTSVAALRGGFWQVGKWMQIRFLFFGLTYFFCCQGGPRYINRSCCPPHQSWALSLFFFSFFLFFSPPGPLLLQEDWPRWSHVSVGSSLSISHGCQVSPWKSFWPHRCLEIHQHFLLHQMKAALTVAGSAIP